MSVSAVHLKPTIAVADLGGYRLEDQIGFYLRKASQRHASIFMRGMDDDLTPTQWAALVKVAELKSVSQNQLGRETAMDVATIKGVVDRLIRRSLVTTHTDPDDCRRNLIEVTPAGRDVIARKLPAAAAVTEETLKSLSAAERAQLLELLRRIA
jgi:MarR family transcriptional regulator, lower aerobic nicotinate degradation pathway regulator